MVRVFDLHSAASLLSHFLAELSIGPATMGVRLKTGQCSVCDDGYAQPNPGGDVWEGPADGSPSVR